MCNIARNLLYLFQPTFLFYQNQLTMSLTTTQQEEINAQITQLETQKTGDMFADMDIMDQIHNLKMKRDGVRPTDSQIECVGCGS